MANWCENTLTISGSPKSIQAIKQCMFLRNPLFPNEESPEYALFDFNRVIPMPKLSLFEINDWAEKHWGSKSNACDTYMGSSLKRDEDFISLDFYTAWSPPMPVIQQLIERYCDCEFVLYYYEASSYFAGEVRSTQEGRYLSHHYTLTEQPEAFEAIATEYFDYQAGEEHCM